MFPTTRAFAFIVDEDALVLQEEGVAARVVYGRSE